MVVFRKILGLPKTIFFNLYYFPLREAIKFPVIVAPDVRLLNTGDRSGLELSDPRKRVYLGYGESFALGGRSCWSLAKGAMIRFKGFASLGRGTQIIAGGNITFGDNFYCNANCIINAGESLIFGNNCLLGWNVMVLDGDGHKLIDNDGSFKRYDPVQIGNHVWCASNTKILKGAYIPDNSVVAAGACISKKFMGKNLLLGAFNQILKTGIEWSRNF